LEKKAEEVAAARNVMVEGMSAAREHLDSWADGVCANVDSSRRQWVCEARAVATARAKALDGEALALAVTAEQLEACAAMCDNSGEGAVVAYVRRALEAFSLLDEGLLSRTAPCVSVDDEVAESLLHYAVSSPMALANAFAVCQTWLPKETSMLAGLTRLQYATLSDVSALNAAVECTLVHSVEVARAYSEIITDFMMWPSSAKVGAASPSSAALLLSAMRAWPGDADVQLLGVRTLSRLVEFGAPPMTPGDFEAIFTVVGARIGDVGVLRDFFFSLARMSPRYGLASPWRVRVVELVARARAAHPLNGNVALSSDLLLSRLSDFAV